jgi:hypothetical protein
MDGETVALEQDRRREIARGAIRVDAAVAFASKLGESGDGAVLPDDEQAARARSAGLAHRHAGETTIRRIVAQEIGVGRRQEAGREGVCFKLARHDVEVLEAPQASICLRRRSAPGLVLHGKAEIDVIGKGRGERR